MRGHAMYIPKPHAEGPVAISWGQLIQEVGDSPTFVLLLTDGTRLWSKSGEGVPTLYKEGTQRFTEAQRCPF